MHFLGIIAFLDERLIQGEKKNNYAMLMRVKGGGGWTNWTNQVTNEENQKQNGILLPCNEVFISYPVLVYHAALLGFYRSPERTNQTLIFLLDTRASSSVGHNVHPSTKTHILKNIWQGLRRSAPNVEPNGTPVKEMQTHTHTPHGGGGN